MQEPDKKFFSYTQQDSLLGRGLNLSRCLAISGSVFGITLVSLYWNQGPAVSWLQQFKSQDVIWLLVLALFWNVLLVHLQKLNLGSVETLLRQDSVLTRWFVPMMVLFCFLFSWIGTHTLYHGYALSMDEFIDLFQVKTFLSGDLVATVNSNWREFGNPLQPINIKYDAANAYWSMGVLPLRAAFQTLFSLLGDVALAESFCAAATVFLVYLIAQKIWPEQVQPHFVAAVFLVGSTQFLIISISPYAMTTMLFFSVLWLYLYLTNTYLSHGLGCVTVFIASGLHHWQNFPIFILPFLFGMLVLRQWKIFALYGFAVVLAAAFWKSWPAFSLEHWYGIVPTTNSTKPSVAASALNLLYKRDAQDVINWLVNLFRFFSWQHILLAPMVYIAAKNWRSMPIILRVVALGVAFQALIYSMLYPSQGHGWGYRFLHEQLVGLALVAAFGWEVTSRRLSRLGVDANQLLIGTSIVMLALALPIRAVQVEQSVRPYASADSYIKQIDADIVLLDIKSGWYSQDLVRNEPDLTNRPLVMALQTLGAEQIKRLCQGHDTKYILFDTLSWLGIQPASNNLMVSYSTSMQYDAQLKEFGCTKVDYQSD